MTNQTETLNASEQVNQALADILTKVTSGVEGVVDFSKEQIPDVVEQLLLWHTIEDLMFFVIGALLFTYGCYLFKIGQAKRDEYMRRYRDREITEDTRVWSVILTYLVPSTLVTSGFITVTTNLDFIKIMVAPKLYLIEYAAKLMGG